MICVLISGLWTSFTFMIYSAIKNICWHNCGYVKTKFICHPFVYSKTNGVHLLSTTLTYHSLLMDYFPDDFVEEQSKKYEEEKAQICIKCENCGITAQIMLQLMLVPLVFWNQLWILFILANGAELTGLYIMDDKNYKGILTKRKDYTKGNMIFYLARVAAYQGKLQGELCREFIEQAKNGNDRKRFELYQLKSIKAQSICSAACGKGENALFDYFYEYENLRELREITNEIGQEKLECLKIFADSVVLKKLRGRKRIILNQLEKISIYFQAGVQKDLCEIWIDMLKERKVCQTIDSRFDQTKQILSDTDIYNWKIYKEYSRAWEELHDRLLQYVQNFA